MVRWLTKPNSSPAWATRRFRTTPTRPSTASSHDGSWAGTCPPGVDGAMPLPSCWPAPVHSITCGEMTNSVAPTRRGGTDKRERLVAAATQLLLEQGIERTTLAEIAAAANVPLANVYYYFRTKGDLVADVVSSYIERAKAVLHEIEI